MWECPKAFRPYCLVSYLFQAADDGCWFRLLVIYSDIHVMLTYWMWYTGSSHTPGDERSWMASSFTGWGGCPLVQTAWRWDGSSLLHCMDNPQESPWLKLGTICVPTNRRNYCISWPILSCQCHQQTWISTLTYKQGPSHIPILKYYWEMKEVIICPV